MTKAIIWKEWKRSRWLFMAFLVAAIVIPALPAHVFPNEGETARAFMWFIWMLFSLSVGWLFGEQSRRGTLPFLLARPATKPYLFCMHYLSYLIMLVVLAVGSLAVHYVHMAFRFSGFSPMQIIFEPELLFTLAECLLLFSFSLFVANSFVTFGSTKVGIAILVLLILMALIVFFSHPEEWIKSMDPRYLDLIEAPLTNLLILFCGIVFFAALSLWEICFDEMRDARNRGWIGSVISASLLALVLLAGAASAIAGLVKAPTASEFKQVFAKIRFFHAGRATEGVLAFTDDAWFLLRGDVKNLSPALSLVTSGRLKSGIEFTRVHTRGYPQFVYLFDEPIWGQEIRTMGLVGSRIETVSPRHYSRREKLGSPFPSPAGDRVAYLVTSSPRFSGKSSRRLWIAKPSRGRNARPISDYAELPGNIETTHWEPIGWTPDGYDFMLRKIEGGEADIWAVDWVARGPRRFLEDHPTATITEDDLPGSGGWISLIESSSKDKWKLYLLNCRSGESISLGSFESEPTRAWAYSGRWFAYWEPVSGLSMYRIAKEPQLHASCLHITSVRNMRWHPHGNVLSLVANESDTEPSGASLSTLDVENCVLTPFVKDFPATKEQWDWLSDGGIVYADGGELWRIDLDGSRTLMLSLGQDKD